MNIALIIFGYLVMGAFMVLYMTRHKDIPASWDDYAAGFWLWPVFLTIFIVGGAFLFPSWLADKFKGKR
jgi:uncharacterized membrane-anchored protein YitT (DUF2179 family)